MANASTIKAFDSLSNSAKDKNNPWHRVFEHYIRVRDCPSLVGGRPAKSVVRNGRVGSNPTSRANLLSDRVPPFVSVLGDSMRSIASFKAFSHTLDTFKPNS